MDILRPMVLGFKNNNIMDLADKEYRNLEITDIMKTMDNRHVMDTELLRENGFNVPTEEDAELQTGIAQKPDEEVDEYVPG